jgi:diguanylate cyclase (GGDEF)-like protein
MDRKVEWSVRVFNIRNKLTLGTLLLLSVMLLISTLLASELRSLVETLRWQAEAAEIAQQIQLLDKLLTELMLAQGAGEPARAAAASSSSYLTRDRLQKELARLRQLADGDRAQAARLEQLERLWNQTHTSALNDSSSRATQLAEMQALIDELVRAQTQMMRERRIEAESESVKLIINVAILSLLIVALTLVWSQRLVRRIVDPISQMMLAAERLTMGELAPRVAERSRDEIGQLARAFNRMAERISEREMAILARNRELDELHEFNALLQTSVSEGEIHRALLQKVNAFDLLQALILDLQTEDNTLVVAAALHPLEEEDNENPAQTEVSDNFAMPHHLSVCRVVRAGREMVVQDVADDLLCADCRFGQRRGSSFCVPITAGGQTIGALHLASPQTNYWTEERQRLVKALVDQAGPTINNLRLMEMMRNRALVDEQTQVYNRRFLDGYLRKQIGIARRHQSPLSVMMLDIDHFKQFNDRYGHEAGDIVLRQFANTISSSLREGELVARYGGEEFTVVMHGTAKEALNLAERLRRAVATLSFSQFALHDEDVRITMSVGIAEFPTNGQTPEEVLKAADMALYRAKHSGRNCVKLATRTLMSLRANR